MKCLLLFFFGLFFMHKDIFYFLLFWLFLTLYFFFGMTMEFFGGKMFFDEISFFLLFLVLLIFLFCFLSSLIEKWENSKFSLFSLTLMLMLFLTMICFSCVSIFLFYASFELIFMLMYIFLLSWSKNFERLQASFYMVFYTIVVSLPFLIFIIMMENDTMMMKFNMILTMKNNYWWFFTFMIFLVKLPVYFVHLWLPKAHVEAPISGSMLLAGVLLKLGGYGILRMAPSFLKYFMYHFGYFISLGSVGSLIACFICLRQSDLKSLVAYSSICHMGLVLSGMLSFSLYGKIGSIYMMIAHGFCSSCLFYILYVLYERFQSRSSLILKGTINNMPMISMFWFIFCVLNLSIPPFFSFYSELSILVGVLGMNFMMFFLVSLILFFTGVYCIFMYVSVSHGNSMIENISYNLNNREFLNFYGHFFPLVFIPLYLNYFM